MTLTVTSLHLYVIKTEFQFFIIKEENTFVVMNNEMKNPPCSYMLCISVCPIRSNKLSNTYSEHVHVQTYVCMSFSNSSSFP